MNSRCAQILYRVIKERRPLKLDALAALFSISPRTIRYDLDRIDAYLTRNGFPQLTRKTNQGISLLLEDGETTQLFSAIDSVDSYVYVLSQRERMVYILYILLEQHGYTTVNELAEELAVSKNTIQADLKEIKNALGESRILLETSKGRGVKVIGDELEVRKAASKLLFENFDTLNMLHINFIKLFKDIDLAYIERVIRVAEAQMENTFADYAFNNLLIHLAVAIKRIQMNKDIVMEYHELKNLSKTTEFSIAAGIARMLEEKYLIAIPDSEIGYIAIHLLGSNFMVIDHEEKEDYFYLQMIVSTLIEKVGKSYKHDFSKDEQLFENLLQHMRPAIYRLRHCIHINNPMLKEIKSAYLRMFTCVKNEGAVLLKDNRMAISEEEIGYITIHFMTSLERLKEHRHRKAKVLVVCATGIGTSKFVSARLKTIFDVEIVDTISTYDLRGIIERHTVDLIVTTVEIEVSGIKTILVEPFLNEKNISELSLFFSRYVESSATKAVEARENIEDKKILGELLQIIDAHCIVKDAGKLTGEIRCLLRQGKTREPTLADFLSPAMVRLNVAADDWEDAVRKGGQLLLNNGCIAERYIAAMIENVHQMGAYIILLPGIAMPHATPESGVMKTGFSIITLRRPVAFGRGADDAVQVIISMAAEDRSGHIAALKELVGVLERENFVEKLNKCTTAQEVLRVFLR